MTALSPRITVLDNTLAELTARLDQALLRADRLEHSMERIARGTDAPPSGTTIASPVENLRRRRTTVTKHPIFVGDRGTTAELTGAIEALLRMGPATRADLVRATGARQNRVAGVIVGMWRAGRLKNIGQNRRALWSLVK